MIGDSWQSQSHPTWSLSWRKKCTSPTEITVLTISPQTHGRWRQAATPGSWLLADHVTASPQPQLAGSLQTLNVGMMSRSIIFLCARPHLPEPRLPLHINIFCKHVVLIFHHSGLRVKQLLIFQSINFRTIKFTAGSRAVTAQNNKTNLCFASIVAGVLCPVLYHQIQCIMLILTLGFWWKNVRWWYWILQVQYVMFQMNGYFVYRS